MDADFSHDPNIYARLHAPLQAGLSSQLALHPGGSTPNWTALRLRSGGGNASADALLRLPVHD
jgi:hypothetical protein